MATAARPRHRAGPAGLAVHPRGRRTGGPGPDVRPGHHRHHRPDLLRCRRRRRPDHHRGRPDPYLGLGHLAAPDVPGPRRPLRRLPAHGLERRCPGQVRGRVRGQRAGPDQGRDHPRRLHLRGVAGRRVRRRVRGAGWRDHPGHGRQRRPDRHGPGADQRGRERPRAAVLPDLHRRGRLHRRPGCRRGGHGRRHPLRQ